LPKHVLAVASAQIPWLRNADASSENLVRASLGHVIA
jgi:hypothetical protein